MEPYYLEKKYLKGYLDTCPWSESLVSFTSTLGLWESTYTVFRDEWSWLCFSNLCEYIYKYVCICMTYRSSEILWHGTELSVLETSVTPTLLLYRLTALINAKSRYLHLLFLMFFICNRTYWGKYTNLIKLTKLQWREQNYLNSLFIKARRTVKTNSIILRTSWHAA